MPVYLKYFHAADTIEYLLYMIELEKFLVPEDYGAAIGPNTLAHMCWQGSLVHH